MRPLCFVVMPFGKKPSSSGAMVDFDTVYRDLIQPAIEAAGMEAIRADEEQVGGWIHKPMFERLMLCDYAVADLSGDNANVYYELGVRHALRPRSTIVIFQRDTRLPIDVAALRGVRYDATTPQQTRSQLTARLRDARHHHDDSPVYQFLTDLPRPYLDHSKTDVFRTRVNYSQGVKRELAAARAMGHDGLAALDAVRQRLGPLDDEGTGIVVDLYLSYRALDGFAEMEHLYYDMPVPLQRTRLVREQRAFALNRSGRSDEAEEILLEIIANEGASPETHGLLGRVYKDRYTAAEPGSFLAKGYLQKAIDIYLAGFEVDWRDAYPGINAVSLMEHCSPPDPRQAALLPVVRYAVERKIAAGHRDYWDYATLLELAVLARDAEAAQRYLMAALPLAARQRDIFAPGTTARNLAMLRALREARGEDCVWLKELEGELVRAGERLQAGAKSN